MYILHITSNRVSVTVTMAGLGASLRPSSLSSSLSPNQSLASRLVYLLTLLPLSLAALAFLLQWRGGATDPAARWSSDALPFPGMTTGPSRLVETSDCAGDVLARSRSPSFPYFRDWKFDLDPKTKISITTSTSAGLQQILPWIFYHKVIGVSNFFLFVEGKAASQNVSKVLESLPGVKVVYRTAELEKHQAKSRVWNETWLSGFFYQPCNYELFVKQSLNMEMAIVFARDAGMEWIFHLDTDELIHPAGTSEYSVRQLLEEVPEDVDMVVFPNYESSIERDDIKEPFSEVSMFKKNYDHLTKDTYYSFYKEATRDNPNYFLTYGNGKSAARVKDHLRPHGAHRWHNYKKSPNEVKLEEAAVLHYTYTKFSDLTSRRDRCGCKPTKEDVKRCFMLEFDRAAFIIASTATQEEMLKWYREHVVWTNKALNTKLTKRGILTRVYAPMVIIQGLREAGVFSSVLASHTNVTDDRFGSSSSSSSSNSSVEVTSSIKFSSRKIGKNSESQATTRKVLQEAPHTPAMPPLPPPRPEDLDFDLDPDFDLGLGIGI